MQSHWSNLCGMIWWFIMVITYNVCSVVDINRAVYLFCSGRSTWLQVTSIILWQILPSKAELVKGWHRCWLNDGYHSHNAWWRHQMETFSALLVLVTGEFPSLKPVTRSFDVFFDLRLDKRLSKQSRRRWFKTSSSSLWRNCNELAILRELDMYISLLLIVQTVFIKNRGDYIIEHVLFSFFFGRKSNAGVSCDRIFCEKDNEHAKKKI